MQTLTIPAGIRSVAVILADGREIPGFVTRKESSFTPDQRVKSEKGTMSFEKDGARITVKTNAVRISGEAMEAIHQGLCLLASVCNGAASWDNAGFSKTDTVLGKSLATAWPMTTAQVFLGANLCRKYKRQLPESIVELASSILPPKAEKPEKKS